MKDSVNRASCWPIFGGGALLDQRVATPYGGQPETRGHSLTNLACPPLEICSRLRCMNETSIPTHVLRQSRDHLTSVVANLWDHGVCRQFFPNDRCVTRPRLRVRVNSEYRSLSRPERIGEREIVRTKHSPATPAVSPRAGLNQTASQPFGFSTDST